jgi:hypothetical protein
MVRSKWCMYMYVHVLVGDLRLHYSLGASAKHGMDAWHICLGAWGLVSPCFSECKSRDSSNVVSARVVDDDIVAGWYGCDRLQLCPTLRLTGPRRHKPHWLLYTCVILVRTCKQCSNGVFVCDPSLRAVHILIIII